MMTQTILDGDVTSGSRGRCMNPETPPEFLDMRRAISIVCCCFLTRSFSIRRSKISCHPSRRNQHVETFEELQCGAEHLLFGSPRQKLVPRSATTDFLGSDDVDGCARDDSIWTREIHDGFQPSQLSEGCEPRLQEAEQLRRLGAVVE